LKQYNVHTLRSIFGLVQQEPLLFNYSIRDNVAYGKISASPEDIQDAIETANASDFIDALEKGDEEPLIPSFHEPVIAPLSKGYEVGCGSKGGKLSGG
jgi:ABC-type multidrug transport system fused ATPase/permease subunit